MKKLKCHMNISKRKSEGHSSQVIAGFMILKQQGIIDLEINYTNDHPFTGIIQVIVNDEINILYDVADGYLFNIDKVKQYAENADFYFKRSFNSSLHRQYDFSSRIYPLGLNYHVTIKGNVLDLPMNDTIPNKVKWYVKQCLGKNYAQKFYVENFEDIPKHISSPPLILFTTRTWSDEDLGLNKEETNHIDNLRADCIRKLRKEFGNNFIGGFSLREYARKNFPDCLLDESITNRINFMKLVKKSDICISTMGLHGSNGWKLGEYVAASKSIVSEELRYEVPNFYSERNYLEFTTSDSCIEQVSNLYKNKDLMYKMKVNNNHYYNNYLKPDKLIFNTLMIATEKCLNANIN